MPHFNSTKTGGHTTLIEQAVPIVKHLDDSSLVTKISLGRITNLPTKRGSGIKRARLVDDTGCLLIEVTQNKSVQVLRVYASEEEMHSMKLALARFVRNEGYELRFHSRVASG